MPDSTINELDKDLLRSFFKFHKVIHPHNMNICENNMKYGNYKLLFHIKIWSESHSEGASSAELSNKMFVKPPTINPILLDLEKEQLIERKVDPSDRRILRITLTPKGEKLTNEIENIFFMKAHELVSNLGVEKSRQLIELINEAYDYLIQAKD